MKSIPAILSAFAITAVIGVSMLAIGLNALVTPNAAVMASAPADSLEVFAAPVSATDNQTADLQALVGQYQEREKQYQQRMNEALQKLNQANQQIEQANTQLQQAGETVQSYQDILNDLQSRGAISIDEDGQITVSSSSPARRRDH